MWLHWLLLILVTTHALNQNATKTFFLFNPQHASLSASRSEKGSGWSSRSLGARCRNSIASCSDEQPHIGNYRLLKTIGKGNFAKVKLARHILTGREVRHPHRWLNYGGQLGVYNVKTQLLNQVVLFLRSAILCLPQCV